MVVGTEGVGEMGVRVFFGGGGGRGRMGRGGGGLGRGGGEIPGMADHKGHFFGSDGFGGDDEVAFVFARGGVEDDDEVAVSWFTVLAFLLIV